MTLAMVADGPDGSLGRPGRFVCWLANTPVAVALC